ncbi:MAG: GNAT family N-acetyltransferase [Candidatus Berkiellales bacterium]
MKRGPREIRDPSEESGSKRSRNDEHQGLTHTSPNPPKTEQYKYINWTLRVPRECYLKAQLGQFLQNVHSTRPIIIRGYQDKDSQNIEKLNYFYPLPLCAYKMRNGHDKVSKNMLNRLLTLEDKDNGIIGAIHFFLDLENKRCIISRLEINEEHRRKHYGSILLQCAIFIALHYQISETIVSSSPKAKAFYPSQGFKHVAADTFCLDFNFLQSRELFLEKVKDTCPSFDNDTLLALLGEIPLIEAPVSIPERRSLTYLHDAQTSGIKRQSAESTRKESVDAVYWGSGLYKPKIMQLSKLYKPDPMY